MKSEEIDSWQESYDKPRQCVEKQRHYSADKGPYSQGYGLPSGHVQLKEMDHKEGPSLAPLMPTNWCLWTVVLEKTPESPLDSKEIKPVNLKGNQPWILVGRTNAEAEAPIIWLFDVNNWFFGKVPWCWERLRAEGEEGIRGWDDWMASLMQWTWTWANFGRWWETGRSGILQSVESQSWIWLSDWTTTATTQIIIWSWYYYDDSLIYISNEETEA